MASSRKISPVEMCGIPSIGLSLEAYVPFPEPGGPKNMILSLFHPVVSGIHVMNSENIWFAAKGTFSLLRTFLCPLKFSRISLEVQGGFAAFAGAKSENGSVVADVHHPTTGKELLPAEGAFVFSRHLLFSSSTCHRALLRVQFLST